MYIFKLKKQIAFFYEVDLIPYKGFKYIVLLNTLIDNPRVQKTTLKSGKSSINSGYFNQDCEYDSLDQIVKETLKFRKQYMMISAIFHNDGTY